jgi:DNA-binding LacI/PurR family transcriptional regulator/anti-anti-sigma regulatory factor/putative methionine-R-sulfoxide reductase with GAF domain
MGNRKENQENGVRPTIGVLAEVGRSPYHRMLWEGFVVAARELAVNLIWFSSSIFNASDLDGPRTIFRETIIGQGVDGLLISATLGNFLSATAFKNAVDFLSPLPMMGIAQVLDFPSVVVDNAVGMREAVAHLVEVHGYRRIAFVRGPEGNREAALRYRAYADVLAEHDIPLDPDLVAPGTFDALAGEDAIPLLLDERKVEFEAIVTANDLMAFGALTTLQQRGLRIPEDVAVVGFDDTKEAAASTPSLTTVRQPIHRLGRACLAAMIRLLAGERIADQIVLPTTLVVRQSCGCVDPLVASAIMGPLTKKAESLEKAIVARREEIVSEMVQAVKGALPSEEWAGQLLDAFLEDMSDATKNKAITQIASSSRFLALLEGVLSQVDIAKGPINEWQGVISIMRRHIAPYVSGVATLSQAAEDLFHAGRVIIGEMNQKKWAQKDVRESDMNVALDYLRDELILTVEEERIWDVLCGRLSQLGFSNVFLSFYDRRAQAPRYSKLVMAYVEGKRAEKSTVGQRFPTSQILPDDVLPRERRYTWLVAPLEFGDNEFGYIVLEAGPRLTAIYRTLTRMVSGALQDSTLIRQLDHRRIQMLAAAEVSQAVSGMLDLSDLLQNVVALVQERFDLYYVGLFLVEGAEAVLRAATGEVGQKMLERGYKLKVGGDSMVGRCMSDHQACIALDVGQEAVRFDDPLLPDARSELALPLVGREGAIGALCIQSPRERAFGEEDVAVFQTIADQLANAITNARLYEATQKAYAEVERQVQERTAQLQREMEERERAQEENLRLQQEVIEAQQRSIQELSTPIIPVFEGIIVMPLIGSIDTMRARDVTRSLLAGIRENQAEVVILDITGVPVVDSGVAAYLNRTVQAARLKGARAIVTGVSEAVAETIVDLGIDWSGIETLRDLQTGLRAALYETRHQ